MHGPYLNTCSRQLAPLLHLQVGCGPCILSSKNSPETLILQTDLLSILISSNGNLGLPLLLADS